MMHVSISMFCVNTHRVITETKLSFQKQLFQFQRALYLLQEKLLNEVLITGNYQMDSRRQIPIPCVQFLYNKRSELWNPRAIYAALMRSLKSCFSTPVFTQLILVENKANDLILGVWSGHSDNVSFHSQYSLFWNLRIIPCHVSAKFLFYIWYTKRKMCQSKKRWALDLYLTTKELTDWYTARKPDPSPAHFEIPNLQYYLDILQRWSHTTVKIPSLLLLHFSWEGKIHCQTNPPSSQKTVQNNGRRREGLYYVMHGYSIV